MSWDGRRETLTASGDGRNANLLDHEIGDLEVSASRHDVLGIFVVFGKIDAGDVNEKEISTLRINELGHTSALAFLYTRSKNLLEYPTLSKHCRSSLSYS